VLFLKQKENINPSFNRAPRVMKQKQLITILLKILEHLLDENQRMKHTIDRYRNRANKSFHGPTHSLGKFTEVD